MDEKDINEFRLRLNDLREISRQESRVGISSDYLPGSGYPNYGTIKRYGSGPKIKTERRAKPGIISPADKEKLRRLEALKNAGLLDENYKLTDAGKKALKEADEKGPSLWEQLKNLEIKEVMIKIPFVGSVLFGKRS